MDVTCDNNSVCGSTYRDMGDPHVTNEWARSRGWHIWTGTTMSGASSTVTLCPACVGSRRRALPPVQTVQGEQLELDL